MNPSTHRINVLLQIFKLIPEKLIPKLVRKYGVDKQARRLKDSLPPMTASLPLPPNEQSPSEKTSTAKHFPREHTHNFNSVQLVLRYEGNKTS